MLSIEYLLKKHKMRKCPYCNSGRGVYTIFKAMQYYSWGGEPESKFAKCLSCNRKISMKRIQNKIHIKKGEYTNE